MCCVHWLKPQPKAAAVLSSEAEAALLDPKPRGKFRIGTLESTAAARLLHILSQFHERYSDVQIELVTDTSQGLMDRLLEFDVEVAFVAEPVSHNALSTE